MTDTIDTSDTCDMSIVPVINEPKKYSHNDKKLIVKRISDIKNKKCYIKIFKVINNDNLNYSRNDNGIFFNLTNLKDDTLNKIESILLYYENKKNNVLNELKETNN